MENENQAGFQQKYQELKQLEERVRSLNNELGKIENKRDEIEHIKESLKTLKEEDTGKETLFPMANGIFVKGEILDNKKVIMNVGSDTMVEKNIDEAIEMMDKQSQELQDYNESIISEMSKIDEVAYKIQEDIFEKKD